MEAIEIHDRLLPLLVPTNMLVNVEALDVMRERTQQAARTRGLITYSQLVSGLVLTHPVYWPDGGYVVDTHNWTPQDRRMIGEVCGQLAIESLADPSQGFMLSCIVVDKGESIPSSRLFQWLHTCGVLPVLNADTAMMFQIEHSNAAHKYWTRH